MSSKNKRTAAEEETLAKRLAGMLLSPDLEMRELGRITLRNTKFENKVLRSYLLMNSSKRPLIKQGIDYFLGLKKEVKTLESFIYIFRDLGYTYEARHGLHFIQCRYNLVKKIGNYFTEKVDLVTEILEGTSSVNRILRRGPTCDYNYLNETEVTDEY